MADEKVTISRRTFLAGTGLALGGLLGCATAITYQATVVDGGISLTRSELQLLGGTDKPIIVKADDLPDPILLIPIGENNFRAVSGRCTHLGCHVRPSGNFLVCPCHGSTFDLEGQVVRGPAQSPLEIYPVKAKETEIEIIIF